jgi:serine phosphatase RsbU (regulator of sigma subunit)
MLYVPPLTRQLEVVVVVDVIGASVQASLGPALIFTVTCKLHLHHSFSPQSRPLSHINQRLCPPTTSMMTVYITMCLLLKGPTESARG